MRPVLFLDVDGVLNQVGVTNNVLDGVKVMLLREVLSKVNCRVILSSTWRRYRKLIERLLTENIPINGLTPVLGVERGKEIRAWLNEHPDVKDFVILDDDIFGIEPELKVNMVGCLG